MQCVSTSGFVDEVVFSHNGAKSDDVMFGRVRQVTAAVDGLAARMKVQQHQLGLGY